MCSPVRKSEDAPQNIHSVLAMRVIRAPLSLRRPAGTSLAFASATSCWSSSVVVSGEQHFLGWGPFFSAASASAMAPLNFSWRAAVTAAGCFLLQPSKAKSMMHMAVRTTIMASLLPKTSPDDCTVALRQEIHIRAALHSAAFGS